MFCAIALSFLCSWCLAVDKPHIRGYRWELNVLPQVFVMCRKIAESQGIRITLSNRAFNDGVEEPRMVGLYVADDTTQAEMLRFIAACIKSLNRARWLNSLGRIS